MRSGSLPDALDCLAPAFAEVPLTRWVLRRPDEPGQVRRYVRAVASVAGDAALVDVDERRRGAALWLAPDHPRPGWLQRLAQGPGLIHLAGLRRAPVRFRALSALALDRPAAAHHYLEMIGVRADARNLGLGAALLERGLGRADRDGLPTLLHTSNAAARPLYRRHGFEVVGERTLPEGGPTVWAMRREPGASQRP